MAAIILEPVSTQSQIDTLCAIAKTVWHETYDDLLPPGQPDYMIEKFQSDHAVKEQMARENYRYVLAKLGRRTWALWATPPATRAKRRCT